MATKATLKATTVITRAFDQALVVRIRNAVKSEGSLVTLAHDLTALALSDQGKARRCYMVEHMVVRSNVATRTAAELIYDMKPAARKLVASQFNPWNTAKTAYSRFLALAGVKSDSAKGGNSNRKGKGTKDTGKSDVANDNGASKVADAIDLAAYVQLQARTIFAVCEKHKGLAPKGGINPMALLAMVRGWNGQALDIKMPAPEKPAPKGKAKGK